ncbi:MAG: TonB-dependent receptor [Flavobacteriaceae bacterium]|nr:TonB-dependent receptor [Flavobacteriaceae bacterium]
MKKTLLTAYFILFCILYAQSQNFTITGKVVDATTKDALEYATVTFKPKGNSDLIGGITNKKGKFEISVPKGKYTISVEFLSYKTIVFKSQNITNDVHYGSIELSEDTEFLESIEIIGEKKLVERKLNKLVYNVTKDISAEGSMIIDIMNNIPSVFVENGTPTIRGQAATVLINGRFSSLSKSEALKSLPAGSVEKIEVISHPRAQYNASYNSIINVVLKKGKDEGLNASITGSFGHKDIYGGLLTLNNKSKKVNFFTNTSYNQRNAIQLSDSKNEYFVNGITSTFLNENSVFDSKDNTFYTTVGADFYLSKKTTLTTSINYSNLKQNSEASASSNIFDNLMSLSSSNERLHTRVFDNEIVDLNLQLEHQFNKKGRSLSFNFINSNDNETSNNNISNSNNSYTDQLYTENDNLNNSEFDLKYINPINDKSWFTTGYNMNSRKNIFQSTINNNVDYSENVHAGYIEYEYQVDKLYIGVGIRGEFSQIDIDNLNNSTTQKNTLNDFFPVFTTAYTINDSQSISFYYDKGINRTSPSQLQPFEERFSETSSYIGNENLKPMYRDTYALHYSYFGKKITFIPEIFYSKFSDWHQKVTYETGEIIDGVNKLITTPFNLGQVDHYGINIYASYKVNNNINFALSPEFYFFDQKGTYESTNILNQPIEIDFNKRTFNGKLKLLTQLKLPKVFNFQTNIIHYLKSEGPVSTRHAYTYASAALNKDLFDKKATLSLTFSDIFNSNQTKRDRFDTNYFSKSVIKNKNPDIILSFTYRFNQSKKNREIDFDKKDKKPNF